MFKESEVTHTTSRVPTMTEFQRGVAFSHYNPAPHEFCSALPKHRIIPEENYCRNEKGYYGVGGGAVSIKQTQATDVEEDGI